MNGIQFIVDHKGRKTAMVIDLKKHGAAAQDLYDGLIVKARRKEKSIPVSDVIAARKRKTSK
jgi:hypothetical protein